MNQILRSGCLAAAMVATCMVGCQREARSADVQARSLLKQHKAGFVPRRFKKPTEPELKRQLSPMQFRVTQREGTEPPFANAFWNNKAEGIYVDIVSGEPLFSSRDKFHSGTGWPSFTKPLEPGNIVRRKDHKLGTLRIEVRSKYAGSHLGHVFTDGPAPTGLRYCINSAALHFIPKNKLKAAGYGRYLALFH